MAKTRLWDGLELKHCCEFASLDYNYGFTTTKNNEIWETKSGKLTKKHFGRGNQTRASLVFLQNELALAGVHGHELQEPGYRNKRLPHNNASLCQAYRAIDTKKAGSGRKKGSIHSGIYRNCKEVNVQNDNPEQMSILSNIELKRERGPSAQHDDVMVLQNFGDGVQRFPGYANSNVPIARFSTKMRVDKGPANPNYSNPLKLPNNPSNAQSKRVWMPSIAKRSPTISSLAGVPRHF